MHILYLVNALDSPPGVLLDEATRMGASATQIDTVNGRDMGSGDARGVPEAADDFDALVVLGGVMGVYEADNYPFIEESKRLVRHFHDKGKPVMGVCLGSQIVASAFFARKTDQPSRISRVTSR